MYYVYTLDLFDDVVDVDAANHFLDDRTSFVGVGHWRHVGCDRAAVGGGRRHHRIASRQRIAPSASHFTVRIQPLRLFSIYYNNRQTDLPEVS